MRLSILLLSVLVAGCDFLGPHDGDLALETDRPAYAPGAEVRLALTNESARAYEMGSLGCAGLEWQDGEAWLPSPVPPSVACFAVLLGVGPFGREEATLLLDGGLLAGTYRYVHGVTRRDERLLVYSNQFTVR